MEIQEKLKVFFDNLLTKKGIKLLIATIFGFSLVIFAFVYLMQPNMKLLYSNLSMQESSSIVNKLESLNVSYKVTEGGATILVPDGQVNRLRLKVAEDGILSGGTVGYEIFDKSEVANATSFVQHVQMLRALEGELARTIKSIQSVENVRVHIVLPKRELFSKEKEGARAAVMLKLKSGAVLSKSSVQSIQNLVAASVPELKVESVNVMDDRGALLAKSDSENLGVSAWEEAKLNYEMRLSRVIESLLEKIVGFGKSRAQVSADLDMDKITQKMEKYDSENPALRSSQILKTSQKSNENSEAQASTVENNIPEAGQAAKGGDSSFNEQNKLEETNNYEISKTIQTKIKEGASVKRLSVAVIVDGKYVTENGKKVYKARTAAELSSIQKLVQNAIGAISSRDSIEVVGTQFIEDDMQPAHLDLWFGFEKKDVLKLAHYLIAFLGLLIGFFIISGSIKSTFKKDLPEKEGGNEAPNNTEKEAVNEKSVKETKLQEDDFELPVGKSLYLKRLEKLVKQESDKAAATVRFWLSEKKTEDK